MKRGVKLDDSERVKVLEWYERWSSQLKIPGTYKDLLDTQPASSSYSNNL